MIPTLKTGKRRANINIINTQTEGGGAAEEEELQTISIELVREKLK